MAIEIYKTKKTSQNIMVIFGWTGASYEDVKKKHNLLEKTNIDTIITMVTPIRTTLFSDWEIKMAINKLEAVLTNDYNQKNLFILYYSGGGSLYHPIVHQQLSHRVKGYIFDSSPVPFRQEVFSNWIYHKFNNITKHMIWLISYVPLWTFFNFKICNPLLNTYNQYITDVPMNTKSLFITSKIDPLVPLRHIKKIVESQKSDLLLFDKSDHLEHDVMHPTEYIRKLDEFLV